MRKITSFFVLTIAGLGIVGSAATAAWLNHSDVASASTKALALPAMAAPGATASQSNVTVSFPAATMANGTAASAYTVKRYNAMNVASPISGVCTGTMFVTCGDTNVKNGSYSYSVTPHLQGWTGTESAKKAVTVSASLPALNIATPAASGPYNNVGWEAGGSAFSGTSSSATGLANVVLSVRQGSGNYWNGSSFGSATEFASTATGTTNWSLYFPMNRFNTDGEYTVRVLATDLAGNSISVTRSFTIDRSAPTVSFGLPSFVKNGQALSISSSEAATVTYSSCIWPTCSAWAPIGSSSTGPSYGATWTGQPADGTYSVRASATDAAGNVANETVTVKVDNSAPVTTDNATSGWTKTAQTVTLVPTDGSGSGVSKTYYTTNGTTPTTSSSVGTSITLNSQGIYTIKYFSVDALGNTEAVKTAANQVRIDTTDPTAAGHTALPDAINDEYVLTGTGTDTLSGIASVTYLYCSGTNCTPSLVAGTSTTSPNFGFAWTSQPANGTYRVLARVTDFAGNTFTEAGTPESVVIDNALPTGSITAPTGTLSGSSVNVTSNSADSGSGVASATFQYAPTGTSTWTQIGSPDTTSPYGVSLSLSGVTDGAYDIRVITKDNAGNTFTSPVSTVTVNNGFKITGVQIGNGTGNGNPGKGKVEINDTIVVTYSHVIDVDSFCSAWPATFTDSNDDQSLVNSSDGNVVTINNNAGATGNDTLTVTSSRCTLRFGTIDLGSPNYVTGGNATFSGSTSQTRTEITWDASAKQIKVLLGQKGGSGSIPNSAVASSTAAYIPNTSLKRYSDGAFLPSTTFTLVNGQLF